MAVPQWAPGTLYQPGAVVQRRSALPVVQDAPSNASFESSGTDWTAGTEWGYSAGVPGVIPNAFQGSLSAVVNGAFIGTSYIINDNLVPVVPGQVINAHCYINHTGQTNTGRQAASCAIAWFDESEVFISFTEGAQQFVTFFNWSGAGAAGVAPAGAAFAAIAGRAQRNEDAYAICFDSFTWDYTFSEPVDGLVFKAVQANAGYSGVEEPTWPTAEGVTVVDNEVTWEAFVSPSLTWQATPILISGSTEPTWPETMGAAVADGTIAWVATTGQVTDEKCPNTVPVAIAASKVFAGDDDIVAFSATINPLDWSTRDDAGYLPFGLQTYGSTPVTALGLYRGNVVVFNAQSFQMWQVDQDPANMALLDAVPVGCVYPRSVQPLMNDLLFLSRVGVRGITIAGASTNLQADGIGEPVDALVTPKVKAAEYEPIAINYPAGGQYWLLFGPEAFVCTVNGAKDKSWSRYVFPYAITDWTIHDNDLYLRAGDLVWKFDEDQVDDDVQDPVVEITSELPADQVQYAEGSKDAFAPAAATSMQVQLVNSLVSPYDDELPNAVLLISVSMETTTLTGVTAPTIDVDGEPVAVEWAIFDNISRDAHQALGIIRIPELGFDYGLVTVDWPTLVPGTSTVKVSANVMYNVDDSSLDFGDGFVTASGSPTAGPLEVPPLGAVFGTNMQRNGGDADATITSQGDLVAYTMQSPQVFVSVRRYMTGYRLFPDGEPAEVVQAVDILDFEPIIATVLAGSHTGTDGYQGYDPFGNAGAIDSSTLTGHTVLRAAYDLTAERFELLLSDVPEDPTTVFSSLLIYLRENGVNTEVLATLDPADSTHTNLGDVTLDGTSYSNVEEYTWDMANPITEVEEFSLKFEAFTEEQTSIPFEGVVWWPHLDMGNFGTQKNMIGLDVVSDAPEGLTVSVGYDQRDLTARTTAYEIEADTLPGQMIPMPVGGPSFDLKLVFNESQRWELQAANLYIQDNRTGS